MNAITYIYRGGVERGTGGPGYKWHDGFSETTDAGGILYPWMTARECQADAKAKGTRAEFHYPANRMQPKLKTAAALRVQDTEFLRKTTQTG